MNKLLVKVYFRQLKILSTYKGNDISAIEKDLVHIYLQGLDSFKMQNVN